MNKHEQEDIERSLADRDYWQALAPEGYRLMGFTYRQSALYSCPGDRHTINIEADHIEFFKAQE